MEQRYLYQTTLCMPIGIDLVFGGHWPMTLNWPIASIRPVDRNVRRR